MLHAARGRVAALSAVLQASQTQPVRLVETHISWVLLADTLAYKLKKPLKLPFLDFTTLAARRRRQPFRISTDSSARHRPADRRH